MYKLLLCWRYLRTRYIALASIVSVMLGVATMIVVNAVMAGFTHEMQDRIHGILSDLVFESCSLDGAPDAAAHMERIERVAGQYIDGMSPTAHVPAMLGYYIGNQYRTQPINLIGIDEATYASVSDFGRYLQHPDNRERIGFGLHAGGYDGGDADSRSGRSESMKNAGWRYRRAKHQHSRTRVAPPRPVTTLAEETPSTGPAGGPASGAVDPFQQSGVSALQGEAFDPMREQHVGCVLGIALASYRNEKGVDTFLQLPGDDVEITYPSAGRPPKPLSAHFTVVDFYESKMSEYDSSFVFVPLRKMQELRGMVDPATGVASFNSIQINVKEGVDLDMVRDLIRAEFPAYGYNVSTWRDKQGALLAAVQMETAVLNVLLFMIIAVAGFGILAIFYMIVVEKTRDIGILKSLGASSGGVMGIFMTYGLALGVVGAGVGMIGGLLFVRYINEIADGLGWLTGRPVFDPSIYFFQKIPTIVHPMTVGWIAAGAMAIAVLASVMPARRAAAMHPVAALRWD